MSVNVTPPTQEEWETWAERQKEQYLALEKDLALMTGKRDRLRQVLIDLKIAPNLIDLIEVYGLNVIPTPQEREPGKGVATNVTKRELESDDVD